jgi:hypothetical protein
MNKMLVLLTWGLGTAAALHLLTTPALAQVGQGVVRGQIVNGTTGEPGRAETLTLYDLSSGMEAVALAEDVSGTFLLEDLEVEAQTPYLLQATYDGVNYSQTINFGRGYEAEATLTVYDVTSEWEDIEIETARFLVRREHDRLRIDKLYVVDNKTAPNKTLYDPVGSLRFSVPAGVELGSVSASSSGGMPIPQSASPLSDGSGYAASTALKPGTTDLALSYEVDYASERYFIQEKTYHPISELLVLVSPADIQVEAPGWEEMGPDPQGRFTVFRQVMVEAGSRVEMVLSGGSEHAADLTSSPEGESSSGTKVTTLPDPTRAQKWIIVALMGAALAYGLLTALIPAKESQSSKDPRGDGLRRSLADLEQRRQAGNLSAKSYRKKKRELQAQLERASGREKL